MIHIYGLCYRILKYPDETIKRLRETASEDFHLTCIESRSCNSDKFFEWGMECLKNKKIQKFITSSTNSRGYGFNWSIKNFPPDNSEDFFIITDLDLLVPKNFDWIKEIREKMKKNVICGFTLSNENYVSPNFGWNEHAVLKNKIFGIWLMAIKREPLLKVLEDFNKNDIQIQDNKLIKEICKYGTRDIIDKKLYHLGWDAWKDDPEYWKEKKYRGWQQKSDKNDLDKIPVFKVYE